MKKRETENIQKEMIKMGLLDAHVIENLIHSSSVSKGIERTMEHMINELDIESMYIIHYEKGVTLPEIDYEWEQSETRQRFSLEEYLNNIEEWYHFEESDLYVARATTVLPVQERQAYKEYGYEACVEFQIKNHGNVVGYIIIGWDYIKELSDEEENDLHVLLKLMSELLTRQFYKDVMGESEWKLFRLSNSMTRTMLYMLDEKYRIQYINTYAREQYPAIKTGDYCYKVFQGHDRPCKDCPVQALADHGETDCVKYISSLENSFIVNASRVQMQENKPGFVLTLQKQAALDFAEEYGLSEKKFIFALKALYKDLIAVEIRKDTFLDFLEADMKRHNSYSMNFVLKWLSKVHLDDRQKFLECFDISFLQNDFMNGVTSKDIDFRYRTHEGSYHCMNGRILFDQNANKDVTVYILFQDVEIVKSARIEEQKQLQDSLMAAKSAAELKGNILANISHEIRNPMNGIISMVSVAKQVYKEEDRLLDCLDSIDKYTEHMMKTMDSLLETVKIDNDRIIIANRPFRLDQFLNRIDLDVRKPIEKKNVQFNISLHCQFKKLIGDETRLYQALFTLIKNSVSYTPISGAIRLSANQVAADQKTVYIRFALDDTGSGLSERMKESIFGFEHDANAGYIEEEHFNLSLAAKIIRLMGGDIGVNMDGAGTHLYFTLPFKLQEADVEKVVKKKMTIPQPGDFSGRRILLAEDSEMGRDALRAVLEVVGFQVDEVDNGKKAVIRFVSQPAHTYDAVLMDIHMPYMDGREATRCIRISGKEDGEEIPIIGLMSNTYEEDIEESLASGMQAHLSKPVDVEKLYRVLGKVIADTHAL